MIMWPPWTPEATHAELAMLQPGPALQIAQRHQVMVDTLPKTQTSQYDPLIKQIHDNDTPRQYYTLNFACQTIGVTCCYPKEGLPCYATVQHNSQTVLAEHDT